jgi:glycosyltransferase involved in cell wall biosynthesis
MRIAIFAALQGEHGRDRLLCAVARVLLARGHAVDLVLPRPVEPAFRPELPTGARIVDLVPCWLPRRWRPRAPVYLTLVRLAAYLRRTQPDVLLGGSIPPNLTALVARRRSRVATRIVLRQSNVIRIAGDPEYGGIAPRRRDGLVKRWFGEADAVIAVAQGVADNVVKATGIAAARVHAVPAGIDADVAARAAEPLEHPWFAPGAPPVLVTVGRQVPKKDHATLLRALARLRATRDVRLVILGGRAGASADLDALIPRLGLAAAVDRPGSVANVFPYLARANAFILSSMSEGMPNALLEAMASGCPVVSTDCPSGPNELLDGGRYAPLVPVGDDAALAEAIARVLDDPPDTGPLRERAAAFSVGRSAEAYADILERVGQGGTAPVPGQAASALGGGVQTGAEEGEMGVG